MKNLEPPELFFVSAAHGWLELGDLAEARAEMKNVGAAHRNHPDVLEVKWEICARDQQWVEGLQIARELLLYAPERSSGWLHQAYALRRVPDGGVKQAWTALLPAFDKFPTESIIPYNLSCYACQLKLIDAARVWLKRAAVLGGKDRIKRMALSDPDLKSLWPEIKEL
jgi:hypothetical protein